MKASIEKNTYHIYKGLSISSFLIRNLGDQKAVGWYNQSAKENGQPRLPYLTKLSFRYEIEIKTLSEKKKLKEFIYH